MEISKVIDAFKVKSSYKSHEQLLAGHINITLLVTLQNDEKYILQRMNKYVFKNPVELMENIINVTKFMKKKYQEENKDYNRYVLDFVKAKTGNYYYKDDEDEYWRMYHYIDNSDTYYAADKLEILFETGKAFGSFQRYLSDFDASLLHETIPNFHNTIERYKNLKASAKIDKMHRFSAIKELYDEFLLLEPLACKMTIMLNDGLLPLRVTHNDTKCNNVLIDNETNKALAVIDLDTIMPGLSGFDFGDSIRSGTAKAKEDEENPDLIGCDVAKFEAYARGFLSVTKNALTKNEIDTLVLGAFNMTIEVGVRFLTDYLDGDVYFHTSKVNHNLIRAKNQLAMAKDILRKSDQLDAIIAKIINE